MKGIFDLSVQFGLQFEEAGEEEAPTAAPADAQDKPKANAPAEAAEAPPEAKKHPPTSPAGVEAEAPPAAGSSAEIARLNKFRKK